MPIPPGQVTCAKIEAGAITTARIAQFDPDELPPSARAQWDLFDRRMQAWERFDRDYPLVARACGWPIVGSYFSSLRRDWILQREP